MRYRLSNSRKKIPICRFCNKEVNINSLLPHHKECAKKYYILHRKIRDKKIKPEYCQICNEKKKLELCSINHTYTENPKDYIFLCRGCHRIFDKISQDIF